MMLPLTETRKNWPKSSGNNRIKTKRNNFTRNGKSEGAGSLKVENFDSTLKPPVVEIKLKFEEEELKSFEVSKGDLITYCEDIAGETGVPLFVTYIDDIYIPGIKSLIGKEAKVILKYTWAISKHIRTVD